MADQPREDRPGTAHEWRALMQYRLSDTEARQMTEGYGHPEVDNAPVQMLAAGEGPAKGDPRVFLGTHNLIRNESMVLCYACEQPWTPEPRLAAKPCEGEPGAKLAYVDDQGRDLHPNEAPAVGSNIGSGMAPVGRNDPCPCGSGKKFKRCHGRLVMHHRTVTAKFRLHNAVLDLWDRLRGRCANAPLFLVEGGYHFWRCGLRRGHDGPCRSGYYFWGPGGSIYDPEGPWAGGCDRRPVRTRRQRRSFDRWHAFADAKRRHSEQRSNAAPSPGALAASERTRPGAVDTRKESDDG